MIGLLNMPNEILLLICHFLMMKDVACLAFTCKGLLPFLNIVKKDRDFREVRKLDEFPYLVMTYNVMIDLPIYSFVKYTREESVFFEVEGFDRSLQRQQYLGPWQPWMDDRPELSVSEGRTVLSNVILKVGQEHDIFEDILFSDSRHGVVVSWIQIKE